MKRLALAVALLAGCDPDCSPKECRDLGGTPAYECERRYECAAVDRACEWQTVCYGAIVRCRLPAEAR